MAIKESISQQVAALAAPIAERMGLMLWDVTFAKEGSDWCLTLFVDKQEGEVDLQDCENFSREIDPVLDEADPIDKAYYLQVFTAGLERRLTTPAHLEAWLGKKVWARTIAPRDGERDFFGTLASYDPQTVTLSGEGEMSFPLKELSFLKADDFQPRETNL